MADPDLELRGGGGWVLIYSPYWPFSLRSFLLFLLKIRGTGPPGPSPRSATGNIHNNKAFIRGRDERNQFGLDGNILFLQNVFLKQKRIE